MLSFYSSLHICLITNHYFGFCLTVVLFASLSDALMVYYSSPPLPGYFYLLLQRSIFFLHWLHVSKQIHLFLLSASTWFQALDSGHHHCRYPYTKKILLYSFTYHGCIKVAFSCHKWTTNWQKCIDFHTIN